MGIHHNKRLPMRQNLFGSKVPMTAPQHPTAPIYDLYRCIGLSWYTRKLSSHPDFSVETGPAKVDFGCNPPVGDSKVFWVLVDRDREPFY